MQRALVRAALLLVAWFGLVAPARAADTLRVGLAMDGFSFTPLDVGIQTGIFARHGIAIEKSTAGGSAKLQMALASGAVDIGLSSGPALAFIAKGAPVIGVAALSLRPVFFCVIVGRDAPVRSAADLKGRMISVSTVGSLTFWLLGELSRSQGWGPDGIKAPPLGADAAQVAAMRTGQTDGMVIDVASAYRLEASGDARIVARFGDVVRDFVSNVIYAHRDFSRRNPDALRRFLAGWFESVAFMHADKPRTLAISEQVLDLPPEIANRLYDEVMPDFFSPDGRFDPKALAMLQRSFVDMDMLPTPPDMSKLVDEEFLPQAGP